MVDKSVTLSNRQGMAREKIINMDLTEMKEVKYIFGNPKMEGLGKYNIVAGI